LDWERQQIRTKFGGEKLLGRRPSGNPRRTWKDNINIDIKEIGFQDEVWMEVDQNGVHWYSLVLAF
jgi:hypothetical protein